MRLEHPTFENIQQGAIFNCVRVQGYENCDCYGVVLTARCDLAHAKSNVINYLPIVRFSDWVQREMCFILAKRIHGDLAQSIDTLLDKKQISSGIRATFPLKDIIAKETTGKEQATLLQKYAQLELVRTVSALGGAYFEDSKSVMSISGKASEAIIKELIAQKLAEYYFIDATDYCVEQNEGCVALLRHMQTMPVALMEKIVAGLEQQSHEADSRSESTLTFARQTLCMITGVLRSPDIEHLAQQFSHLFGRIGVADHQQKTIQQHFDISKSI